LPPSQIEKVLRLVMKAQKEAEEDPKALYFLFFRNKGKEIGVVLTLLT
jgi:UDPglucose--hexose-1-phosphate uridylyltransferase